MCKEENINCYNCGLSHYSFFCLKADQKEQSSDESLQSDHQSNESPPETVGSVSASAHPSTGKEETVLFMCVRASDRSPTKSVKANIFLDSFRTFLTEELNDKLDLKPIGRDSMKICSFGSQNPEASTLNRVMFDVVTNFGDKISLTGNVKSFSLRLHQTI
jgi:hypothetical protein